MSYWKAATPIVSSMGSIYGKPADFKIAIQGDIGELLKQHMDEEKALGAEIHPATRNKCLTQEGKDDDDCIAPYIPLRGSLLNNLTVCKNLDADLSARASVCGASTNGLLDW
jgi:hypothetical protein